MNEEDKSAAAQVLSYARAFASNRGLSPVFPRLVTGMMRELAGWPVRNADGGGNIAYFSSQEAADKAISAARRVCRASGCVGC